MNPFICKAFVSLLLYNYCIQIILIYSQASCKPRCNLSRTVFFVWDSFDRHTKRRSTPSRFFCNRRIYPSFSRYGTMCWRLCHDDYLRRVGFTYLSVFFSHETHACVLISIYLLNIRNTKNNRQSYGLPVIIKTLNILFFIRTRCRDLHLKQFCL